MSVKVRIPAPLRKFTGDVRCVDANGQTVKEVLDDLENSYHGMHSRICDESGTIRRFINIFINGEDIRYKDGVSTSVKDGDEISITPAIAGGKL